MNLKILLRRRALSARSTSIVLACAACAVGVMAFTKSAQSGGFYEPIFLTANAASATPGQPLSCTVQLTGGPEHITVYSSPAGAVSYSGTVSSATATFTASTSSTSFGSATVYVVTDGQQVASTRVRFQNNDAPEGP